MPSGRRRESLVSRKAARVKYELDDDFAQENGLVCGGQMEVFIEPIEPAPAVYVIGAGHVGYYLAKFAHEAGFLVHVIDDREAFANRERFPDADRGRGRGRARRGWPPPTCRPRRTW